MKPKQKLIAIQITAQFGSDFQEQVGLDSLEGLLKGWQTHVHSAHKGNKLEINKETL